MIKHEKPPTPGDGDTYGEMVERIERETGSRVDQRGSDAAFAMLGAVARAYLPKGDLFRPNDDVALGMFLKHEMSPEATEERAAKEQQDKLLLRMLGAGLSPEEIKLLNG